MKDFFRDHPIVSLFMVDCVVTGVLKGIALIKGEPFKDEPKISITWQERQKKDEPK